MSLYEHSIQRLLESQTESGAFLASAEFPSYRYSWFRDSSFIAYALCRSGHFAAARRYFVWSAETVNRYADKAERAIRQIAEGKPLDADGYLHTRYTPDGDEADGLWWDFQLDGFGTWLWALAEYVRLTEDTSVVDAAAVRLVVRYLTALWQQPNYDCWEELPQFLHPHTLAAIHCGLLCSADLLPDLTTQVSETTAAIRKLLLAEGMCDGHFSKSFTLHTPPRSVLGTAQQSYHDAVSTEQLRQYVDASLIGLATPYDMFGNDDARVSATIGRISTTLHRPNGGVYRYLGDTYYGGGEWVLLAAWLGWHYARIGRIDDATQLKQWVEAQADKHGDLPEQLSDHLLAPDRYDEWRDRWGAVAKPLAWSHAMYVILCEELR